MKFSIVLGNLIVYEVKIKMKTKWLTIGIILLFVGINSIPSRGAGDTIEDFDPLVDIEVTIDIISIRVLDENISPSKSIFFVKVIINSEEFSSPVWNDSPSLYDIHWKATLNVPDDKEFVNVTIQLWGDETEDIPYDISGKHDRYDVTLLYSIKTGHWTGDDSRGDVSGYGRLCGCDDGSLYGNDRDCELWFDITQNDADGDHIPYWYEVNVLGTDPLVDDTSLDPDNDSIPTYWEYRWGYNPLVWDDFANIDPDNDSINNIEEFLTSEWLSDPYRRDLFIEIDTMAKGPLGQNSSISSQAKELLNTAFDRRNILCHLDDGCMGGGGEIIPFDRMIDRYDLRALYNDYFLHNDSENWRRGVFRYAMIVYGFTGSGMAYVGKHPWLCWHASGTNTFVISAQDMHKWSIKLLKPRDVVFASVLMHETGHTLGIDFMFPIGCDMKRTVHPRNLAFWIFRNYKTCMNYRYVYSIIDYSDGSHGLFDYDEWSNLDFSFFEEKMINSW